MENIKSYYYFKVRVTDPEYAGSSTFKIPNWQYFAVRECYTESAELKLINKFFDRAKGYYERSEGILAAEFIESHPIDVIAITEQEFDNQDIDDKFVYF